MWVHPYFDVDMMIYVYHPHNCKNRNKEIQKGDNRHHSDHKTATVHGFFVLGAQHPGVGFPQVISSRTLKKLPDLLSR